MLHCKNCRKPFSNMKELRCHKSDGCDYNPSPAEQTITKSPPKNNKQEVLMKQIAQSLPKGVTLTKMSTKKPVRERPKGRYHKGFTIKNINSGVRISRVGLKKIQSSSSTKCKNRTSGQTAVQNIYKSLSNEIKCTKVSNPKVAHKKSKRDPSGKCFWNCKQCPQIFSSEDLLKDHEEQHDGNSTEFPKRTYNRRNRQTKSTNPKPNQTCNICDTLFPTVSRLKEHIKATHVDNDPIVCAVCSKNYSNQFSLLNHQLFSHKACTGLIEDINKPKQEQAFLCDTCGKDFKAKYLLERHIRMHLGIKTLACSYCGRKFAAKDTLKKHERIHTGEKPYSCHFCGKAFRQDGPFRVHLRTHTGERPYVCKICGNGFLTNQMLKFHNLKGCVEISSISTENSKINVSLVWSGFNEDEYIHYD